MPEKYVVEMFCDRVAASKNYNGDKYTDSFPLEYYLRRQIQTSSASSGDGCTA